LRQAAAAATVLAAKAAIAARAANVLARSDRTTYLVLSESTGNSGACFAMKVVSATEKKNLPARRDNSCRAVLSVAIEILHQRV